jgi:hypothetical protein
MGARDSAFFSRTKIRMIFPQAGQYRGRSSIVSATTQALRDPDVIKSDLCQIPDRSVIL